MITDETMTSNPIYCSDYSLASGEPLAGTATQTDGYILVECNESWGEKALEESQIPWPVKDYLKRYTREHPTVKVLLVRAPRPFVTPGLRCFVACTEEQRPELYAFQMSTYDELLNLDFSAVLAGDAAYQHHRRAEPLMLVCTNGRRDFCCARQGVLALNAMVSVTQDSPEVVVWHSTHLGGHRFAANLLCLPYGLLYGRVGLEQAPDLWQACQQGQIYLPSLRGRTCYPAVVQAADHYLRTEYGLAEISALRWLDAEETAPGEWLTRFQSNTSGENYVVQARVVETKTQVFDSCKLDKTVSVIGYEFSRR